MDDNYIAQVRISNKNEFYQLMKYLDSLTYVWSNGDKLLQMDRSYNMDIVGNNYNVVISIDYDRRIYWGAYDGYYYPSDSIMSIQQFKEIKY